MLSYLFLQRNEWLRNPGSAIFPAMPLIDKIVNGGQWLNKNLASTPKGWLLLS
jgi:hypothetical protein